MYEHRLVDMRRNEIIVSRKRTWCSRRRSDGWLFQKALYRSNVLQFFCLVKRSPNGFVSSNMSYSLSPMAAAYHSFRIMGLRQLASFAATSKQNACTKNTTARRSRMLAVVMGRPAPKTRSKRLPSYMHVSGLIQLKFRYELVRRFHLIQSNSILLIEA